MEEASLTLCCNTVIRCPMVINGDTKEFNLILRREDVEQTVSTFWPVDIRWAARSQDGLDAVVHAGVSRFLTFDVSAQR